MPTDTHRRRASHTRGRLPWLALGLSLLAFVASAEPVTVASVTSPGKVLRVSLQLDGGTPSYRVERFGQTVVDASRLGFQLRDGRLDRDLAVLGQNTRTFDETWEQPWGERRYVRNHYNEVSVQLGERSGAKRRFEVVFRAFDDGVGFRYHFPEQAGLDEAIIDDELTEFAIAPASTAWWIPAGEPIHYEYLYQRT
ncbi:MAG TPA: alpha-glucosidase, partial [Stenotrophomonas sp.]|nr:alpha-glucosidase [Stenotrophomonas sp.]